MKHKILIWVLLLVLLVGTVNAWTEYDVCPTVDSDGQVLGMFSNNNFYLDASNFSINSTNSIINATTYLYSKVGTPGQAVCQLRPDDGSGEPSATILLEGTIDTGNTSAWNTCVFNSSYEMNADTPFWIVWTTANKGAEVANNYWTQGTITAGCADSDTDTDIDATYNPNTWGNPFARDYGLKLGFEESSPLEPVINNATYNFTNAFTGQNTTAWRDGNGDVAISTRNKTPRITFDTFLPAYCRINTVDENWTTMDNDRNCTTTGATSHDCLLPDADALVTGTGYTSIYLGCIDTTFTNETSTATSEALNVSLDLYNMQGTTKYVNGTVVENGVIMLTDQLTNVSLDNVLSNSTGNWIDEVYGGIWSACWAWTIGSVLQNTTCATNITVP